MIRVFQSHCLHKKGNQNTDSLVIPPENFAFFRTVLKSIKKYATQNEDERRWGERTHCTLPEKPEHWFVRMFYELPSTLLTTLRPERGDTDFDIQLRHDSKSC